MSNMTEEGALRILDTVTAGVPLVRADQQNVVAALQTLQAFVAKHQALIDAGKKDANRALVAEEAKPGPDGDGAEKRK